MTKVKSKVAKRKQKAKKLLSKTSRQPSAASVRKQKKKKNRKSKHSSMSSALSRGSRKGISMVSDGVNVGSVWKNTTAERVTFPMAREKFSDLTSTGTTLQTLAQLVINPGNRQLFPIFSEIAKNYEQYECNHLKILYRTEEYMASGSVVSAGLACLATNFDPDAANFATFTQAENYEHSISGAPFSGIIEHDILAEHKKRFGKHNRGGSDLSLLNYFVNYSQNLLAPGTQPAKFFDMGNFQCLVNGTQAGVIGELWIEYSFTLIRRLQQPGAPEGGVVHFSSIAATTGNNFAAAVQQSGNTLAGITLGVNTITWGAGIPGNYFVSLTVAGGTSASAISGNTESVTNLVILTSGGTRDVSAATASLAGTTTSAAMFNATVSVTAAGGNYVLNPSTIVGTGSMDLFVIALPSTVLTLEQKIEKEESAQIQHFENRVDSLVKLIELQTRQISHLTSLVHSDPNLGESTESESGAATPSSVKVDKPKRQRKRVPLSLDSEVSAPMQLQSAFGPAPGNQASSSSFSSVVATKKWF
jgi:hypothetical protein